MGPLTYCVSHPCRLPSANQGWLEVDTLKQTKLKIPPSLGCMFVATFFGAFIVH